ncbi:MAG: DUF1611 domain-containing protein [Pseudomonadota bacterium]
MVLNERQLELVASEESGGGDAVTRLRTPYLVFLGGCESEAFGKTALGIRDWTSFVIGQQRFSSQVIDLGVPDLTAAEAKAAGAGSFVIGVSAIGGLLPDDWREAILSAIEAGLDVVSGLHHRLNDEPSFVAAAKLHGVTLHDIRHADRPLTVGTGSRRSGHRLLSVGTDCALGKKYAALALARAFKERGVPADFRATGQTGIMIAGRGVAIDAVPADFISGAVEELSPAADDDHWDLIEGQGSLFHPAYAGVSLGLLHGAQADCLVLCHDPSREHLNGFPDYPMPSIDEAIRRNEEAARLTNPDAKVVALSLNTSKMSRSAATDLAKSLEDEFGLPCMDVMRFGVDKVVDSILS